MSHAAALAHKGSALIEPLAIMKPLVAAVSALLLVCACSKPAPITPAPAPHEPRRYGPIMVAVGRHHEMLGRALVAGRWELAAYAIRELDEELEELRQAEQPEEAHANLSELARAFPAAQLPPISQAITAHDLVAARAAYALASTACNGCHETAGFAFLVVPTEAGAPVPTIAPAHVDAAVAPDGAPAPDAAMDASVDVAAHAVADAAADVARRLPGARDRCDDRVGCARGLICCTHGGIAMPATHHGTCMTFRGCNTQPSAQPR